MSYRRGFSSNGVKQGFPGGTERVVRGAGGGRKGAEKCGTSRCAAGSDDASGFSIARTNASAISSRISNFENEKAPCVPTEALLRGVSYKFSRHMAQTDA
ncbi:hypothetical protein KM043_012093 [Ampulex compressa]|nr:hypothetical protein KM043_012093 [Ampulex compressa]